MKNIMYIIKILTNLTIYQIAPPYNINWFRNFKFISIFLNLNPITVVDIGARGGSLEELENLIPYIHYIGFDADAEEAERLNKNTISNYKSFKVYPFFVGSTLGQQPFNLYHNIGSSSQLQPNKEFQISFDPTMKIVKTINVEATTLDDFIQQSDVIVDILKMDCQGTEFEVLEHGHSAIDNALIIESEVEFVEMYDGQKLFHDISKLLYSRGFTLLYLNRVFSNRHLYKAPSRGQIIFGDALFGLNMQSAMKLSWERQKKYCVLLINYGHIDFAYEIFSTSQELKVNSPELLSYFEKIVPEDLGILRRIKIALVNQWDKLIYILLLIRKTNHLAVDSDRSWPIR